MQEEKVAVASPHNKPSTRKNLQEQALQVLEIGGGKGIRTLVGGCPNGFQDFLESWSVQVILWQLG